MEPKQRLALKSYTPALCWGIFVTYMSLTPGEQLPEVLLDMNDKFLHVGIYFFSAALIYMAIIRYNFKNPLRRKQLWSILIVCVVFGGLIELAQYYLVHNRNGDWYDFTANTIGAVLSVLLMRLIQRFAGSLIR